jgi:hypothetical protein
MITMAICDHVNAIMIIFFLKVNSGSNKIPRQINTMRLLSTYGLGFELAASFEIGTHWTICAMNVTELLKAKREDIRVSRKAAEDS